MTHRVLALISGGLDSALAVALVKRQGIDVLAVHFRHIFQPYTGGNPAYDVAHSCGVELQLEDFTPVILGFVRNPPHGTGKRANPCIDCRINQLRTAKRLMGKAGCDFIVTGEVLGQRPMSQRADAIRIIEKEAKTEGLVLRPLSARHLPETIPEKEGWVDRAQLEGFRGRTRRPQLDLAKELGIEGFTSPAGGCLLTDPGFSLRFRDYLDHSEGPPDPNDIDLLKQGRHFRLGPGVRAVIGRNEKDNQKILALARPGDVIINAAEGSSPDTLLRGDIDEEHIYKAAELTARYSKWRRRESVEMTAYKVPSEEVWRYIEVAPAEDIEAARLTIAPPRPFD